MIDYAALGERIREVRVKHRYTQKELATKLHFSIKHYGNIERGNARPSLECLVDISIALDVPLEYLLCDSLPPRPISHSNELAITVDHFLEQQQWAIQQLQKSMETMRV